MSRRVSRLAARNDVIESVRCVRPVRLFHWLSRVVQQDATKDADDNAAGSSSRTPIAAPMTQPIRIIAWTLWRGSNESHQTFSRLSHLISGVTLSDRFGRARQRHSARCPTCPLYLAGSLYLEYRVEASRATRGARTPLSGPEQRGGTEREVKHQSRGPPPPTSTTARTIYPSVPRAWRDDHGKLINFCPIPTAGRLRRGGAQHPTQCDP